MSDVQTETGLAKAAHVVDPGATRAPVDRAIGQLLRGRAGVVHGKDRPATFRAAERRRI
jgi:hypothetical protein